jgi:hypothetical protein
MRTEPCSEVLFTVHACYERRLVEACVD